MPTFNEGAYGAGGYPAICNEQWDTMPFTSEHLFHADHKGIASGVCIKCRMSVEEWNRKMKAMAEEHYRWLPKLQEAYRQGMVDADVRAYEIEKKVREEALREVEELALKMKKDVTKAGESESLEFLRETLENEAIGYNEALSDLQAAIKENK